MKKKFQQVLQHKVLVFVPKKNYSGNKLLIEYFHLKEQNLLFSFSKLSSKSVAKVFIDETSGRVLDNLHKLIRSYSGSKKDADKLLKAIIKTIVKLGILYKNDLFTPYELKLIEEFRNRFHSLSKAIVTFYEVDFTFDRLFLTRMCKECQDLTHKIISTHLTQKSHTRIDYVFNSVSNLQFLEYVFNPNSTINRAIIKDIVQDMNSLMDAGLL
jgi:hypothetical protein